MTLYDNIVQKISNNSKNIDEDKISLIAKYFVSLFELDILKDEALINSLVLKVVNELENIIYYDNNDEKLLKELGISKKNKGLFKGNIIYINKNMEDDMIKITLFHELTHFLQRYNVDGYEECIGIMQNYKWRILMEAQTQNVAEMVYSNIFGNIKEELEYNSEELRMLSGGTIKSNLRNYQMYDMILRKILLVLNMSIEDFIAINFNGKQSLKLFEEKLDNSYGKKVKNFIWELLDIIYSTDAIVYTGGVDNLSEPCIVQSLVDNRTINVSSEEQFKSIKQLDSILLHLSKQNIKVYSKLLDLQFDKREKYMQQSNKFSEVSQTSMEEVENNPEKFIMTECIPACKELWSKNIYTFMVSNYIGENGIWIEIYDEISDENLKYLKSLKSKNISVSIYHDGCYKIEVNHIGKNASDLLLEVCKGFKMQDVPKNIAYFSEEEFLIKCGCYNELLNPNYVEMKEFYEMEFDTFEEQKNYMSKYREWELSENSKKIVKTFNPNKKEKTTEEYVIERDMIYEDGRVYLSKFDYEKHLKYVHYIEKLIDEQLYLAHYENGVETINHKL
ncbi:hypothetical protein EGP95_06655 [bacterium]|nr:hypothetical protein [bacterium]